ncbi:MAG: PEP-CTERM sorting domain-containing protein [Pirellulaceae bacterium]|nr:PEP-CTERM sorting domain-containing protein [Pirellulaceae bacterium]
MIRMAGLAVIALLCGAQGAMGAVVSFKGTLTSYTTVVGAADPIVLGLPEDFTVTVNTSGSAITNGGIVFTGNSGKQFNLTGGTINIGATTDFSGISIDPTFGSIGGTLNFSFAAVVPNNTQAGLDALIGSGGSASIFGFPFTNGSAGFYQGAVTAVPEPGSMLALAGLVAGCGGYRWRRGRNSKQTDDKTASV